MLTVKLDRDPYDDRILCTGRLTREIPEGITILTGCNGFGKTTILNSIKSKYIRDKNYKILDWANTTSKRDAKDIMARSQNFDILASLAFSSEGEEINTNIGILASRIGGFMKESLGKNLIILLDGMDSGFSIDNIIEVKEFFHDFVLKDAKENNVECYILITANEYELTVGERCIDARSGKEVSFENYDEYKKYILKTRKTKNQSQK